MYFRLEIEPKTQFLTVVITGNGCPHFLLRDLRNLLQIRKGSEFSSKTLDSYTLPSRCRLRELLPQGYGFKYETFLAISEGVMIHIMEDYVRTLDPDVYTWFQKVWVKGEVDLIVQDHFLKALDQPLVSSMRNKMPRFMEHTTHKLSNIVLKDETTLNYRLNSEYVPALRKATLDYFASLEIQRLNQTLFVQPDLSMAEDTMPEEFDEMYSITAYKGEEKETFLGNLDYLPDQIHLKNRDQLVLFKTVHTTLDG